MVSIPKVANAIAPTTITTTMLISTDRNQGIFAKATVSSARLNFLKKKKNRPGFTHLSYATHVPIGGNRIANGSIIPSIDIIT
jgi:hypothetical protein